MKEGMCQSQIIGYMSSQLFIAKVELQAHLEVYDQPDKERLKELLGRLEKAIEESEYMWQHRT
jgi:hypothetical protein